MMTFWNGPMSPPEAVKETYSAINGAPPDGALGITTPRNGMRLLARATAGAAMRDAKPVRM